MRWLLASERAPDVALVQELLPEFAETPPPGYRLVVGHADTGCPTGCTSAVLVRDGLGDVVPAGDDRPFAAMGSYVAAATLKREGGPVWLVSVHASPTKVPRYKLRDEYRTRSCETGPWWSDVFVAELGAFASQPVSDALIAGDLNVAYGFDFRHVDHTCGAEFFGAVADLGVVDTTLRDWRLVERPTRRKPDYQHARVFATRTLAERVAVDRAELDHDGASDHAAIWFCLEL